jgi:two-component system cell cycle response regulator DivK
MPDKILIVDDNEKNRKLLSIVLERGGYEAIEAENGEEAVAITKERIPALVLMDIQLPVMDGIQALKAIQADENIRHIPVLAVTSYAMKGDRERLLGEGFVDYVPKPINKDDLLRIIKITLEKRYG